MVPSSSEEGELGTFCRGEKGLVRVPNAFNEGLVLSGGNLLATFERSDKFCVC